MLFNPDSRCCKECGRVGVIRHNFPSCPCNFCKSEGHIADKCPRLTSGCSKCGEKGVNRRNCPKCPCFTCGFTEHVAFQCPRKKLEVRQATGPLGGGSPHATGSRKQGLQSTYSEKSLNRNEATSGTKRRISRVESGSTSRFESEDLSSLEKTPISTEIRDFPNLETLFRGMMRSFLSSNDNL